MVEVTRAHWELAGRSQHEVAVELAERDERIDEGATKSILTKEGRLLNEGSFLGVCV
jgi:hypothetical protein